MMKAVECREFTDDELRQKVLDAEQELFNLRMQMATGQVENPSRIKAVRRDLARMKTIMHERETAKVS